ncbi:MAG: DoxX family protein [Bacteroidota bacterium]
MMKKTKITYFTVLGIFTFCILASLYFYIFQHESAILEFEKLGYPEHLVGVIALGQIVGLIIILRNKGKRKIEWAYSGFFVNFICAFFAHFFSKYGNGAASILYLIVLGALYISNKLYNAESSKALDIAEVPS